MDPPPPTPPSIRHRQNTPKPCTNSLEALITVTVSLSPLHNPRGCHREPSPLDPPPPSSLPLTFAIVEADPLVLSTATARSTSSTATAHLLRHRGGGSSGLEHGGPPPPLHCHCRRLGSVSSNVSAAAASTAAPLLPPCDLAPLATATTLLLLLTTTAITPLPLPASSIRLD